MNRSYISPASLPNSEFSEIDAVEIQTDAAEPLLVNPDIRLYAITTDGSGSDQGILIPVNFPGIPDGIDRLGWRTVFYITNQRDGSDTVTITDDNSLSVTLSTVDVPFIAEWTGSAWVDATAIGGGIADAPSDGSTYGRNNASWTVVSGGGSQLPSYTAADSVGIDITAGAGSGGAGGYFNISSGSSADGVGGDLTIAAGAGLSSDAGGSIEIQGGNSATATPGTFGASGGGVAGSGIGGTAEVRGGGGDTGGDVLLASGSGGVNTAGNVRIYGGDGITDGGSIILQPGSGSPNGVINLNGPVVFPADANQGAVRRTFTQDFTASFGAITPLTGTEVTQSVTGLLTTDQVHVECISAPPSGYLPPNARVSASDTLSLYFNTAVALGITLGSLNFRLTVIR